MEPRERGARVGMQADRLLLFVQAAGIDRGACTPGDQVTGVPGGSGHSDALWGRVRAGLLCRKEARYVGWEAGRPISWHSGHPQEDTQSAWSQAAQGGGDLGGGRVVAFEA